MTTAHEFDEVADVVSLLRSALAAARDNADHLVNSRTLLLSIADLLEPGEVRDLVILVGDGLAPTIETLTTLATVLAPIDDPAVWQAAVRVAHELTTDTPGATS